MDYNINYREKDGGLQAIISYKVGDKWKQKSKQGFKNNRDGKKKAKEWVADMLDTLRNNSLLITEDEYKYITFKEFSKHFLKHINSHLAFGTIRNYEGTFKAFYCLAEKRIIDITTLDIQREVDIMLKIMKVRSVKNNLGRLKVIFKEAIKTYNIITVNPCDDVKIKARDDKKEIKVVNDEDTKIILDELKKAENKDSYYITLIARYAGLRIGEIKGLEKDDIHLEETGFISVSKQWKEIARGVYGFDTPKSKHSKRLVPMRPILHRELTELISNTKSNGRLFTEYERTITTANKLRISYQRLGYNSIGIHTFRHTYATELIAKGFDFQTVAKLMGDTVEVVMRTYSHFSDTMMNNATNIISSWNDN